MGWKVRRDRANARNTPDNDRTAIREARQAMYAEQAARDAAAAVEAAKMQARARCSCPVCDGAPVDVDLAARIITAMQRLPAHVVNDPAVVAALQAVVAAGRELDRASIYGEAHQGMYVPHRVYAAAEVTPAETRPEASAQITPKDGPVLPSKRKPSIAALAAAQDDEA
ncbi:hypothetical protein ABS771_19995 [Methylobacterium brachiatum]|uniref:Terminase small subunit n=1 Tax=Methylobacterium brachiatum TaxID=269660 RepID=A0ABV1R4V8_9HYPH